jgi:hypothetical protein
MNRQHTTTSDDRWFLTNLDYIQTLIKAQSVGVTAQRQLLGSAIASIISDLRKKGRANFLTELCAGPGFEKI